MNVLFIIISAIIVFFFVLLFSKLTVQVYFSREKNNDHLRIKLRLWGILSYTQEIPIIKFDPKDKAVVLKQEKHAGQKTIAENKKKITIAEIIDGIEQFKRFLTHIAGFYTIIKRFLQKVTVKNIEWHSRIGLGDAASTAIAAGAMWGVKGNALGMLYRLVKVKGRPNLSVHPLFQGTTVQTRMSCMISFRIGQAIVVMIQLLKHWRASGAPIRSSNSKYMTGGT
ncbi:DUF2953 domain-containing protein [Fictibacillus sp. Mic-4]|uniref:DUF2953 domain-containing protein n=1 Tax=Fictibacillus TaxID=1329200 RepID=UPI000425E1C2|nr:DUF2953 domain-containing protein [Fictibacillus gelatini]